MASHTEYLTIRVLIFEWDKNDPKLQVDAEIAELEKVFRDDYHFEVKRVKMGSDNPYSDVYLAMHDTYCRDVRDPSLLIIFYTGHGLETYSHEHLRYEMIWGRDQQLSKFVNWTELLDGPLSPGSLTLVLHGDILMIFDCCFSGNVQHVLYKSTGFQDVTNIQSIVAADERTVAWKAHDGSFTRLLTEVLRQRKGTFFTPAEVLASIDQDAMHSEPHHYQHKGEGDMKFGWLDPALAGERDWEAYGEDLGYDFPASRAQREEIRNHVVKWP